MYPVRRQINPHASRLRREATEAEIKIWSILRNRQLDGYKFRRQASIAPFVADFLCVEAKLVVEIEGSQHGEAQDAPRTAFLEASGYRVLRFWNNEALTNPDGVADVIRSALAGR